MGFAIEGWGMLEDGEAAGTGGEEIEPLHYDEVDEVD